MVTSLSLDQPPFLILTPSGLQLIEDITFIATLNPYSMIGDTNLFLSISPLPSHGDAVRIISNSSFILSFSNNTFYLVNVSFCPNMDNSVQFVIGNG